MTERRFIDPTTGLVVDDPQIRPAADVLRDLAKGKTHDELSEAIWDLRQRVAETGKAGSVTLTISMKPLKENPDMIVVEDEIRLKLPEFPRQPSVFYADRQGNLSRQNPMQDELPGALRAVEDPDPAATVREIAEGRKEAR